MSADKQIKLLKGFMSKNGVDAKTLTEILQIDRSSLRRYMYHGEHFHRIHLDKVFRMAAYEKLGHKKYFELVEKSKTT